jgi:hypothetical protein
MMNLPALPPWILKTAASSPLLRKGRAQGVAAVRTAVSDRIIEVSKLDMDCSRDGKMRIAGDGLYTGALDVSYLKFCSDAYDISPDPRDYVIVDLPIVEADIPNRNMDSFPYLELVSWNAVAKTPVWKTFQWAPSFADHANQDPKKAKGVIFDAFIQKVGNLWIVRELWGCDRGKDPKLAADIISKKRSAYSMGALATYVSCSCHGMVYDGNLENACPEIQRGKGRVITIEGRGEVLVHDSCGGVNFVETSSVEDPAYFGAQSDLVLATPA